MILVQKVGNLRLNSGENLFFRDYCDFGTKSGKSETKFRREPFFRDHYDFGTKSGKSETEFRRESFFFKDHYDFGTKTGVFCLFGPPIFSMSQNGPRLKKVGHPCSK